MAKKNNTQPQLKVRVTPEVKAWLEMKAKRESRSQNYLIQQVLEAAMNGEGKGRPTSEPQNCRCLNCESYSPLPLALEGRAGK